MNRLRLVLDTNVLVSAFLWRGMPGRLVELAGEKEVQLFTSRTLLDELSDTLTKKNSCDTAPAHLSAAQP